MLNRRHIRVKVLQAIYAHFQSGSEKQEVEENNLLQSMEKIYDLYLYQLAFLFELQHEAFKEREDAKSKHFPTEDDLMPQTNFTRSRAVNAITQSEELQQLLKSKKISWSANSDQMNKIFRRIRNTEEYKKYFRLPQTTLEDDIEFLQYIYKTYVFDNEFVEGYYEELNIHWYDDIFVVNPAVSKTIKNIEEDKPVTLLPLYKEREEDRQFALDLFRKVILHSDEYEEWIKNKAQNWELERIAVMDIMLMKMAICEVLNFENVPIKVSLNEYIELAKSFSTPKSSVFINGILDKLVAELKEQGKVVKSGRGLIDN
jgi:transcription antitermination protein NusB